MTMTCSELGISLALLLGAGPSSASPAPAHLLPRSSIAAVLAHRGELGLDDAQVKGLEERDAALQKQIAEMRERLGATPSPGREGGGKRGSGSAGAGEEAPPMPSAEVGRLGGAGGAGGRRGGGMGGHRGGGGAAERPARDPAARAAALQEQIDDADTAAWLGAETLLREGQREKARAVAEAYREALADEREAGKGGR